MCNSPNIMISNPPLSHPSQLAFTPAATLKKKTAENALLIGHLEGLVRAEKIELGRLLATKKNNSFLAKRARPTRRPTNNTLPPQTPVLTSPFSPQFPPTTPTTPDLPAQLPSDSPDASPRGIMHSFDSPRPTTGLAYSHTSKLELRPAEQHVHNKHTPQAEHREMAARGSHWSFAEKARFEAALLKYGPFAWEEIIRHVASRTDKQVKAYAARYRRRKKFAARMQALPMQRPSASTPMASEHPSELSTSLLADPNAWKGPPPVSDVPTEETSLQSNSDGMSGAALSASAKKKPVVDIFGQELSSSFASGIGMDQKAFVDTSKLLSGDLLDDAILGPTDEETVSLSEGPSDVDLLVDRAIDGQVVIEADQGKPLLVQLSEDPYPSDFSVLFTTHGSSFTPVM